MASVLRFDEWQNSNGDMLADGSDGSIQFPSRRNLLYNGAMQVHQRGTSVTALSGISYNTADRWGLTSSAGEAGVYTQTIESDAPTGSGFRKSLKMLVTTASGTLDPNAFCTITQRLEGQDLQILKKGTASAESFTVSFWVKSNVTGTYVLNIRDTDNVRQIAKTYSISASDVWEKKIITFPGDSVGALDNDTGGSLAVFFRLVAGSSFSTGTLPTDWTAIVNGDSAVGQVNLAETTNNYWQITGVQLEIGAVATPFEFKAYGQELAECQRYYYRSGASNGQTTSDFCIHAAGMQFDSNTSDFYIPFPVEMRATPTAITFSNLSDATANSPIINITDAGSSTRGFFARADYTSGGTLANATILINSNNANGYLALSAEL